MQKAIKIVSIIAVVLMLTLTILFFPFAEKPSIQLDHSVLLEYHRVGGIAGFSDTITIFKDGTVHFNNEKTKISSEKLQQLSTFIEKKEFSTKRESLLEKWNKPTCCDFMEIEILINKDYKTIKINEDIVVNDIILDLMGAYN